MYDIQEDIVCPICLKKNQCLFAEDGSAIICVHKQEGAVKRCGNAGWLHILRPGQFVPQKPQLNPKPAVNWQLLHNIFLSSKPPQGMKLELGITSSTLALFGMGWDKELEMWAFPMRNETGQIIGIQKRANNGFKYCHPGSTPGLFIPDMLIPKHDLIVVCEGMSDTATAIDLGFGAIGKYNYSVGNDMIPKLIQNMRGVHMERIGLVVIVADPDENGRRGAEDLRQNVREIGIDAIVICPSRSKDFRESVKKGLTKKQFSGIIYTEVKKQLY